MTALLNGTHLHAPEFSHAELAELNRGFEKAPAQAVIGVDPGDAVVVSVTVPCC